MSKPKENVNILNSLYRDKYDGGLLDDSANLLTECDEKQLNIINKFLEIVQNMNVIICLSVLLNSGPNKSGCLVDGLINHMEKLFCILLQIIL